MELKKLENHTDEESRIIQSEKIQEGLAVLKDEEEQLRNESQYKYKLEPDNTHDVGELIERRMSENQYFHPNGHILRRNKTIKRGSVWDITSSVQYRPEFLLKEKMAAEKNEKLWRLMETYLAREKDFIQKSIVTHIEYTLARTRFDLDTRSLYQGTALSVRDRLLESWNDSQTIINNLEPEVKSVSYLSLEFLLGRLLQNALININCEDPYREALLELGYRIEDIYDKENDPALGNGGLGRLAACYLDSLTTLNFPAVGYGIRYDYGIFKQVIENFQQNELPDYWLTRGNPWETMRLDIKYTVKFYGGVKSNYRYGKQVRIWEAGEEVEAIAFDTAIPGWNTHMVNTLRLWKSFPSREFDFESFNRGDYQSSLIKKNQASFITSVLYPNDSTPAGKELRLKQQYFFCSATIQDIINRFLQKGKPWSEFSNLNAIQLNDTHPAVAIPELLHQLIDIYSIEFSEAFEIVYNTFGYTNHTVLPEALEKWSVELFGNLLPRHLELIYLVNHIFLEKVRSKYPKDIRKLQALSVIEETQPKLIRMSNLCIICSHTVNGVAQLHTELLKNVLFKDFTEYYDEGKFLNITNGVTPRRWVHCAFRELSNLLTEYYENQDWLGELSLLESLPEYIKSKDKVDEFIDKFACAKLNAKQRLANWVKENLNIDIDISFLFDVQVKRIHEYKRQFMNCLYCVYRYMKLKEMKKEERDQVIKRVSFFGGKAAPGYYAAKSFIRLINLVSFVINNDPETNQYFKVIFLPDYKVSLAEIIIPAADLSQHISTVGTEASGTSNMKFAMTGSLILGTRDGANIEIAKEIGEENIFFFGKEISEVGKIRQQMSKVKMQIGEELSKVIKGILNGKFGDPGFIRDYINNMINGGDYYLVCNDFYSYIEAQQKVDKEYSNIRNWYKKALVSISRMGFFSSDRSIQDYSDNIWKMTPVQVPCPSLDATKRVVSSSNLFKLEDRYGFCKKSKSHSHIENGKVKPCKKDSQIEKTLN